MINREKNKEKIELSRNIQDLKLEKKILDSILNYYDKLNLFDHTIGVSLLEYKNYLKEYGYEETRQNFLKEINRKIENRRNELNNLIRAKTKKISEHENIESKNYLNTREKRHQETIYDKSDEIQTELLENLKQIIIIPSWTKLIEKEIFKGFYLNQPVFEILKDTIIFLTDFMVTGNEDTLGEPFMFLSGLGIYYTQFRLTPGEIITDYREITGIILPMDIYDKASDVSKSLGQIRELLITEFMSTIPFSLITQEPTRQMYLRGIIARNLYHPNKEAFDQLVILCRDQEALSEKEGLKVLSGGLNSSIPLYTNEILTEKPLPGYSNLTAGIKNIQPKLAKVITDLQIQGLKGPIFNQIKKMKRDFLNIGFPKLLDWIP